MRQPRNQDTEVDDTDRSTRNPRLFRGYNAQKNSRIGKNEMLPICYPDKNKGLEKFSNPLFLLVRPTGFEPVAPRLGIWCSILLSYGRTPQKWPSISSNSAGDQSGRLSCDRSQGCLAPFIPTGDQDRKSTKSLGKKFLFPRLLLIIPFGLLRLTQYALISQKGDQSGRNRSEKGFPCPGFRRRCWRSKCGQYRG